MNTVLAIIPARVGSKGIPNKNWRDLAGSSPLMRAAECALAAGIEHAVISTDHSDFHGVIREIGRPCVPALYAPAPLHADTCAMIDVVKHALDQIPGPPEQIVVLLQPTQVLRTPEQVRAAIALLASSGADSVVSVVELPLAQSPDLLCEIEPSGRLAGWGHEYVGCYQPTRRQDATPAYLRDGTVYAFRRSTVARHDNIYGRDCRPLLIDPAETCPLDTEADWIEAERRLRVNERPKPGTYGAIVRSTRPWPWRQFLKVATFTAEEFATKGPAVVVEKGEALLQAVREWENEEQ